MTASASFTVTKLQVAYLLGVEGRQVERYSSRVDDPLPIHTNGGKGTAHKFCPRQVLLWSTRQELKKLRADEDGKVYDYDAERARLTHHQANKTALEEDTLKGALIPADMVKETWATLVMSFRAKMIGLPNKAAPQIIGVDDLREAEQILQDFIYDALSELSGAGIPSDSAGSNADGETAAAPDDKPVGRRKAKTKRGKQRRAGGVEDK